MKKIISLIPAKQNSYELKRKNFLKLNGLSLFEISILSSIKSKKISETFISSDSRIIEKKSTKYKINFIKRAKKLSNKTALANEVILDFLKKIRKTIDLENLILVYLQPTSPFRNHRHIDKALKLFSKSLARTLVSVNENKNYFKSLKMSEPYLKPIRPKSFNDNRQNFEKIYQPNGALYIFYASDFIKKKKINFSKTLGFVMNNVESIDIDNKEDYEFAKTLSKKKLIYNIKFK
jgi:CMP-N-acetylneuraminic acid synthetase